MNLNNIHEYTSCDVKADTGEAAGDSGTGGEHLSKKARGLKFEYSHRTRCRQG